MKFDTLIIATIVSVAWFQTASGVMPSVPFHANAQHPFILPDTPLPTSPSFTAALATLSSLTTQPLCHRTASLNLVHDCAGLQEPVDNSPLIRDLVDSYAAALALCDLRRGGFVVPGACGRFTEEVIGAERRGWRVEKEEIEGCLRGLAGGDASWGTWVSYRQRAEGICEAGRWERESERVLEVYRGLVRVVGNLSVGVEEVVEVMEERVRRLEEVLIEIEGTKAGVKGIFGMVEKVKRVLEVDINRSLEKSLNFITNLLTKTSILESEVDRLTSVTQDSVDTIKGQTSQVISSVSSEVSTQLSSIDRAFTESLSTAMDIVKYLAGTEDRLASIETKQLRLEHTLSNLVTLSDTLTALANHQKTLLTNTTSSTTSLLTVLTTASETLTTLQVSSEALAAQNRGAKGILGIWPFVVFPAGAVIGGSYGLRPSIGRNLALLVIGEFVAGGVWVGEDFGGVLADIVKRMVMRTVGEGVIGGEFEV